MIYLVLLFCVIAKCVLFAQRGISWWKGLIPFYSTYILGKTVDKKKLGLITALSTLVWFILVTVLYFYEIDLIATYYDTLQDNYLLVPEGTVLTITILRYITVGITLASFVLWEMLTYQFTKKHLDKKWKVVLMQIGWGVFPLIPYLYFICCKVIYKDGKLVEKKIVYNDIR